MAALSAVFVNLVARVRQPFRAKPLWPRSPRLGAVPDDLTREQLVERLAEVSHSTWMRQKAEDTGVSPESLPSDVAVHDRERAEDTVRELERLGIWPK